MTRVERRPVRKKILKSFKIFLRTCGRGDTYPVAYPQASTAYLAALRSVRRSIRCRARIRNLTGVRPDTAHGRPAAARRILPRLPRVVYAPLTLRLPFGFSVILTNATPGPVARTHGSCLSCQINAETSWTCVNKFCCKYFYLFILFLVINLYR